MTDYKTIVVEDFTKIEYQEVCLIVNTRDWEWYKRKIAATDSRDLKHNAEPEKYPCKVMTHRYEPCDYASYFDSKFLYKVKTECSSCGHADIEWPANEQELLYAMDEW